MRIILRLLALILFLTTAIWWTAAGKNTGWTKTQKTEMKIDEITGIEYPGEPVKCFIPGIDFLAPGLAASLVLAGLSFLPAFRRKQVKVEAQV